MVVELKIEKLKTQVDQIKADLIFLQQEASKNVVDSKKTEELEKEVNKVKADIQKELDELKWKTDLLSSKKSQKLEEMLITIETSASELATLKLWVSEDVSSIEEEEDEEEEKKEEGKGEDEKKPVKNWFKQQIDGFTDSTEEHHGWKNVARVAWGIGIVAIWIRGIKKLFGLGKKEKDKEKDTSPSSEKESTDEKKWFWESWFGKFFKRTGIGTGAYYITRGLVSGNRWFKDFFNRKKKETEDDAKKEKNARVEKQKQEVEDIASEVDKVNNEQDPDQQHQGVQNIETLIVTKKTTIEHKIEELEKEWKEKNKQEIEELEDILKKLEGYENEIYQIADRESVQWPISWASEDIESPEEDDGLSHRTHVPGAAIAVTGWTAAGRWTAKILQKTKLAAESVPEAKVISQTRKGFENIVQGLEYRLLDDQLLDVQKQNIKKSIQYFKEAGENADVIEELKIWQKLWDKLPIETLNALDIDPILAKQLKNFSNDAEFVEAIAKAKSETQIKNIFKARGVINVPDDVVKLLKTAKYANEVKAISRVLSVTRPIKALGRWLRMVPFIDLAAGGIDVWLYFMEAREADLIKKTNELRWSNKQQQANMHLVLGAIDLAVGVGASAIIFASACASSWPPWWVVGVVAATAALVTWWVREVADTYYYELVDFYLRNKEDYVEMYRWEIKSAILQATVRGDDSFSLSWTESFAEIFNRSNSIDKNKKVTLEDAYRTMIYIEEKKHYPTVGVLNPNYPKDPDQPLEWTDLEHYTKEKEKLDKIIALRMEYIKKFLPHTTTSTDKSDYNKYIADIQWAKWIHAIEQIVADSKTYQYMKQDTEFAGYIDIKKYQAAQRTSLKKENEVWFDQLESMYKKDPATIVELYYYVIEYDMVVKDEESYQKEYVWVSSQISFIKRYYEYTLAHIPPEKKMFVGNIYDIPYTKTEEMLKNMESGKIDMNPMAFTEQDIKKRLVYGLEINRFEESHAEYTSNIGQNIIYRIAKEIHGYEGGNNHLDLILYFTPEKKDSLGMYFDDGWYINVNNWSDREFTLNFLDTATPENIVYRFFEGHGFTRNTIDTIDTSTENSDDVLNLEYRNRVSKIVKEEKIFQTSAKNREVQKEIVEYISLYGKEAYVKLPYNLINDAKRAWLGNVEYFFFKYSGGNIDACTSKAYVDEKINIESISWEWILFKKMYIENVREEFSDEEKKYIEYVEYAHDRLAQLRAIKWVWSHEDELDLPEEFERLIGDKYKERLNFKESLLWYDPNVAAKELVQKYAMYHDYFENLYMAILIEVSWRKFSNDIDSYEYLLSTLSHMDIWFFDFEKKILKEGILSKKETEKLYKIINEKKIFGKTIQELIQSSDEEERNKGFWWAKQILKTFLESKTLSLDENARIENINSGEITERTWAFALWPFWPVAGIAANVNYDMRKKTVMEDMLEKNLREELYLWYVDIDTSNIASKNPEEIKVKKLTEKEQKTYDISLETLKMIELTQNNVVRQDQRGNLMFDPEKSTITSRWATVGIDVEVMKVQGLDIVCKDLLELLYMANLINWVKGKLLKEHPKHTGEFFFGRRTRTLYVNDSTRKSGRMNDTDVVSIDAIKEKYPKLLSDINKQTFLTYINSLWLSWWSSVAATAKKIGDKFVDKITVEENKVIRNAWVYR